jgi:hypothetical protein
MLREMEWSGKGDWRITKKLDKENYRERETVENRIYLVSYKEQVN